MRPVREARPRPSRPRRAALVVAALCAAACATLCPAPAHAGDADRYDVAFRRAELRDRALGDLAAAAELYRSAAAEAPDTSRRAQAELRAASCLARAGRAEEAVALAEPWSRADDAVVPANVRQFARDVLASLDRAPAPPVGADAEHASDADPERVAALEEELQQATLRLERQLAESVGAQQELESLASALREKDRQIEALRAQLPPPEPKTAEEALRLQQAERERQRETSRVLTRYAALLHQAGRFGEARELLYDVLAKDDENADAKALLARVAAPLGDRERLYVRIQEVLALARQVRRARLTSEVTYLVQQGRRLLERSDAAGAVQLLERALALVRADRVDLRGAPRVAVEIETLLRSAEAAGAQRAPVELPPEAPDPPGWSDALRAMLAAAGGEIAHGLTLGFVDLDPLLADPALALPPALTSPPPRGATLSTQGIDAPALLAAWLRGSEERALSSPDASLDVVGATVVVLAPDDALARVASRVEAASAAGAPAIPVEVTLLRGAPGAWPQRVAARGIAAETLSSGALRAELAAADVAALLDGARAGGFEVVLHASYRASHAVPFRIVGGAAGRSVAVDVLPLSAPEPGLGVAVTTAWRAEGRADGALLGQRARSGAPLAPGGALCLSAMADPEDPTRDLVVVVRVGEAVASRPAGAPPPTPHTPADLSAAEHLLPPAIARVQELNATLLPLPTAPIPERGEALLARLRRAAPDALSIEMRGGRVLVVGGESAQSAVRDALGRLGAGDTPQRFRVEAYVLGEAGHRALVATLPTLTPNAERTFATALVDEAQGLASARRVLASSARALPLTEPVLTMPLTVRADAAVVVRTPYRRELDVAPGDDAAWGRAETGVVDEGFVLALRPFGRDARGRVDVDVSLRVVRIVDGGQLDRETPLGSVRLGAPRTTVVAADLPVALAPGAAFVVADLRSPFPAAQEERLVLLLRPAP